MNDPYILPNGTLKNKLKIKDHVKLDQAEAALTADRLAEIEINGPKGPFNYDRLKATHHYIFQDVYEWAGQPRIINISKGHSDFTPSYLIQHNVENLFKRLEKDNFLKDLKPREFAGKVTEFFAYLNQIHPFREGNGRTQRAFTEALAKQAGYNIAFDISTKERMADISIRSHEGDLSGMQRFFKEAIDPDRVAMMRKAINFLSKTHIAWNENYMATTEIDQLYEGRFVSQAGTDFMMRTNKEEIIIGNIKDLEKVPNSGDRFSFTSKHQTEFQKNYFLTDNKNDVKAEKTFEHKKRR
ncbi:MAG TPA: Fic family protein [Alphaproteobacteria bacterium]|nr:Fic family protein [Alphaproteobacteria bacterium]